MKYQEKGEGFVIDQEIRARVLGLYPILGELPPGTFKQLFSRLEQFRSQVFSRFSERLTELMSLGTAVAFQKLDPRLASFLVSKPNPVTMTHQALADELGSFRELASRLRKDFEHRGWVQLERGQVHVLDLPAMKKFVNL